MLSIKKRAFGPSFFISLGILFTLAVVGSHDYLGLCLGINSLLIAWVITKESKYYWSIIDVSIYLFATLLSFNLLIFNQATSPLVYFIVAYFLIGFLVFSVVDNKQLINVYQFLVFIFSLLSVWALIQFVFNIGQISHFSYRASVIFANPNTYAGTINLLLLPLITVYLINDGIKSKYLYATNIILFSSLIATQSRGAWLAFVIGFIFLLVFIKYTGKSFKLISFKRLLIGFLLSFVLLSGIKLFSSSDGKNEINTLDRVKNNIELVVPYKIKTSLNHRQELSQIAWENIRENPLTGVGLLNFTYFNYRDTVDYIYGKSLYVHNDYLQLWLELGSFGLLALLSIIVIMYWQGIASLRKLKKEQQVWVIAILSALTTYFIHALISYVFYAPLLVCLATAYLAVLSNTISNNNISRHSKNSSQSLDGVHFRIMGLLKKKTWLIRTIISFVLATFLFSHAAAQISARAGVSLLKENKMNQASELFNFSRKFSPTVSNYYLVEANTWKDIALTNNDALAASRAEKIYAAAMAQNPYDAESRLYRAILHRDGAMLLQSPASDATILVWLEYALDWRPHHHKIQAEYLRTLKKTGRIDEARLILTGYIDKYPDSRLLIKVNDELR